MAMGFKNKTPIYSISQLKEQTVLTQLVSQLQQTISSIQSPNVLSPDQEQQHSETSQQLPSA